GRTRLTCRTRRTEHTEPHHRTLIRSTMAQNLPTTVGVLGGGRMGAGIAHAFVTSGCPVIVVEQHDDAAQAARERVLRDGSGSGSAAKLTARWPTMRPT